MSLLNDALRKRRTEQRPPQAPEAAALFKSSRRGRRLGKIHRAAGICAAAVLLAAAGAWAWRPWSDAPDASPPVAAQTADQAPAAAEALNWPSRASADQGAPVPTPGPSATVAPLAPVSAAPADARPLPAPMPAPTPTPQMGQASPASQGPAASAAAQPVQPRPMARAPVAEPMPLPARRITSEPLYQKARLFQRQGRTAEALAMYREVLKIDPQHFDTRLNLTSIYLQTDQFPQAYALAADLHRQAPAHPQALLNLAIAQIGCGRTDEALPLLDQAAALPQAPLYTIYFHKGVALRQLGQTEAAITWYQKAEALNPGDGRLLFNLAVAFDQNQAYAQAVTYYSKYLDAAEETIDAAGRGQVQARVRALRADLAASENGERTP